ncbi:MAG: BTAD domain-containing putative transcriptional regulator [Streptosporangiaceae bacterium]
MPACLHREETHDHALRPRPVRRSRDTDVGVPPGNGRRGRRGGGSRYRNCRRSRPLSCRRPGHCHQLRHLRQVNTHQPRLLTLHHIAQRGRRQCSERAIAAAGHPLREGLWHKLMLARYRSGHAAGALAVYQEARRILADELGAGPGPRLRQRHDQILRRAARLDISPAT